MKHIFLEDPTSFATTLSVLRAGGVVAFPTDTVYGLLADATNEVAVQKLITFKNRPAGKPISVFAQSVGQIGELVSISTEQQAMIAQLLPGPYTLILPSRKVVSPLLESEKGTLGVRVPANESVMKLVQAFGKPLTATSANMSGDSPHYSASALLNSLSEKKKEQLDLVVDAGSLPRNKPSTVIDLTEDSIKVLRSGDVQWKHKDSLNTTSAEETQQVAKKFIQTVLQEKSNKPVVVMLQGELGAGKTEFVKGLSAELGLSDIDSPTFVVYYEYPLRGQSFTKLYHFDLYNIQDESELEVLQLSELCKPGALLLIEWGEKLGTYFQKLAVQARVYQVQLEYRSETERLIQLKSL